MPISKEDKKRYQQAFDRHLHDAEFLYKSLREDLINDLKAYRREVVDIIAAQPTNWSNYNAEQIAAGLDRATKDLEESMTRDVRDGLDRSWNIGVGTIDDALAEIKYTPVMAGFATEDLALAQSLSADLVTDVSNQTRRGIMQQVELGILGKQTPTKVISEIGRVIMDDEARKGQPSSVFKSVTDRASFIARTETERVMNAGIYTKARALNSQADVKVRKFWISSTGIMRDYRDSHRQVARRTNPALGGKPIAFNRLFQVGSEKARFPLDPRLSAKNTVNCLCRMGTTLMDDEELKEYYGTKPEPKPKPKSKPRPTRRKTKKVERSEATTLKEAQEWAIKNELTHDGITVYEGITVEIANRTNNILYDLKQKYGYRFHKVRSYPFPDADRDAVAFHMKETKGRVLHINAAKLDEFRRLGRGDVDKWIREVYRMGWWESMNYEEIIVHEYGHLLTHTATLRTRGQGRRDVTKYAQTNIAETVAELFVRYNAGGTLNEGQINVLKRAIRKDLKGIHYD